MEKHKSIRKARERLGLSQPALAKLIPCNVATVVRWEKQERENGKARPSDIYKDRLADILGVTL